MYFFRRSQSLPSWYSCIYPSIVCTTLGYDSITLTSYVENTDIHDINCQRVFGKSLEYIESTKRGYVYKLVDYTNEPLFNTFMYARKYEVRYMLLLL